MLILHTMFVCVSSRYDMPKLTFILISKNRIKGGPTCSALKMKHTMPPRPVL